MPLAETLKEALQQRTATTLFENIVNPLTYRLFLLEAGHPVVYSAYSSLVQDENLYFVIEQSLGYPGFT